MPNPASTASDPAVTTRTSVSLTHTSAATFAVILVIVFVLGFGLLMHFAHNLDRSEERQTQSLVEKSIVAKRKSQELTAIDYAFWGDAYKYLHTRVSVEWAYVRENFGPPLFEEYGFHGLFVISSDNRTLYSLVEGKLVKVSAPDWIGQPVDALVGDARARAEDQEVVTRLITHHGTPALITAAAITPGTDRTVKSDGTPDSVMLLVKLLDAANLDEMGQTLGIRGLRLAAADPNAQPLVILRGDSGELIRLQWDPVRPGRQMVIFVSPMILLAVITLLLMTWLMARRNTAAARTVDSSHDMLRRSQAALAISESRFRDVAEASSDWIWEVDTQGRVTYLSERFEAVTGLSKAQWLGTSINRLIGPENGTLLDWLLRADGVGDSTIECRYADVQQRERIARVAARNIGPMGFRGTATDVTEEIQARQRVEYLSRHDVLTGLPNRTKLRDFLDAQLALVALPGRPLAMLTIDLDRFKPVNDLLGHATGDRVLHQVAGRISQCVRAEDIVARVGGDEFVMVLVGKVDQQEIEAVCRRLIELIEQVIVIDGQDIFVSASVGIAIAPLDASQANELLRYSDIALYEAKASGRGTWRFYAGDMNERIIERRRLESDLRYGIKHGQLQLQFQPRSRVSDGERVGAEALVRWQHPQLGLLGPDQFIPIAEESGLITGLGDWVLNTACEQATRWPDHLFVSVNVSFREFQSGHLVERVEAALHRSGLAAARLELELTESVMLEDADLALGVMQALKHLGVRLSMDDFGTGYSSLSYLRSFPFDGLKIDRSFIDRLGDNPVDLAVVQAVIGLGRALSLTVTAEGIETLEQLQLLQLVDCDEGQGYYLSRPMDGAALNAVPVAVD